MLRALIWWLVLKTSVKDEKCHLFTDNEMEQNERKKLFDVEIPVIPVEDNIIAHGGE